MIEPQKWASALGSLSDTVTLPDEDLQFASFKKLFPALTQVPLSEGGVAPQRTDFNTLFKLLGDNIFYIQQGGVFSYSDTADYERGAFVKYNNELYLCIQDNSSLNIHAPTDAEYWKKIALNNEVIVDYQNTNNGYIQFGNGLIFAWATSGIKYGGTVVNKPKPFTTLLAYITDQASSKTSPLYNQACVPSESTNTTDTFVSSITGSGNDGTSVFWIGKV